MTTRSSLIAMRYDEVHRSLRQTDFRLPAEYGNMLNEIYQDKEGNLWVASFDGKSFIIHFTENAPEEFTFSSEFIDKVASFGNDPYVAFSPWFGHLFDGA